jgi:hypothetical protein
MINVEFEKSDRSKGSAKGTALEISYKQLEDESGRNIRVQCVSLDGKILACTENLLQLRVTTRRATPDPDED